jgi:PadR family transcriptional regulator, regulatory protein PadR
MTQKPPRLSHTTLRVLRVLVARPADALAGSEILKVTGIMSGTLYPILMRLERSGWVTSHWEDLDPSAAGRPRKRFYRLTGLGYNGTNEALAELGVPMGSPSWNS